MQRLDDDELRRWLREDAQPGDVKVVIGPARRNR